MTYIIGISAFYHDSSAALIMNGEIISAVQEERFSRIKNDSNFPLKSIQFLLKESSISIDDIEYIAFYEKPFLKFERLIETYLAYVPKGFNSFRKAMPIWLKEKLFQKDYILRQVKKIDGTFKGKVMFSEHHLSHAASAFFPSNFKDAVVLTLDGTGEWATTAISYGNNNHLAIKEAINYPHSVGLLYSAFTYYLGFKVNNGEYKVMGLAPYGTPKYKDVILQNLIDVKDDGSFKLNQRFFDYSTDLKMTNNNFDKLFGKARRKPDDELEQFHMDIASSIQHVIEVVLLRIMKHIKVHYNCQNLCLAGGVALNCVANSKIIQKEIFKNVWIQPAAGDAGGSIGAALALWYIGLKNERKLKYSYSMKGSLLGPTFTNKEIKKILEEKGIKYHKCSNNDLLIQTAKLLSQGKTIGWFQGKMEFGPRALGNRSILADPRDEKMQSKLNLKIKFRESFRPFAPAILEDDFCEWYEGKCQNEFMLTTSYLNKNKRMTLTNEQRLLRGIDLLKIKKSLVPAVTHVDYSSRVQLVRKASNEKFYMLIKEFKKLTGCPMLVNTSFNIKDEPIVCSPLDAYECFIKTDLDCLVLGDFILSKYN